MKFLSSWKILVSHFIGITTIHYCSFYAAKLEEELVSFKMAFSELYQSHVAIPKC